MNAEHRRIAEAIAAGDADAAHAETEQHIEALRPYYSKNRMT